MMQSNEMTHEGGAPEGGAGYGARLRQAREVAGLSLEEVSVRLKMPTRVLHGLESGDADQLGAPIFVHGHARSYARLLGIDIEAELGRAAQAAPVAAPELVSHSHTSRYRHVLEQITHRAIYIVLTATLAIPVWMATQPHLDNEVAVQSLEVPVSGAADAGDQPSEESRTGSAAQASAPPGSDDAPERTPLMASMTSLQSPATEPAALLLQFSGDSWVQVFARDGRSLEQGVLSAGERRSYDEGVVGRIVLGNVAAVELSQDGEPVDLAPFTRANIARFTLSSDGSLAPVAD